MGELYWPWRGNQLKDRDVDVVIAALDELDPDVVLLQELMHASQLRRLERGGAGDARYDGAIAERCGYDRKVGVLVRRGLGARFAEHLLEPTRRGALEARFVKGAVEIRAICLHLDVFNGERRLLQARAAGALIGDPGRLTVAGGDLNYDPEVSARLGREADARAEAALTARVADVARESGPTLVGLLRVDRLLAGGDALRGARARTARHRLPLGDHAPLVVDLELAVDGG